MFTYLEFFCELCDMTSDVRLFTRRARTCNVAMPAEALVTISYDELLHLQADSKNDMNRCETIEYGCGTDWFQG